MLLLAASREGANGCGRHRRGPHSIDAARRPTTALWVLVKVQPQTTSVTCPVFAKGTPGAGRACCSTLFGAVRHPDASLPVFFPPISHHSSLQARTPPGQRLTGEPPPHNDSAIWLFALR